MGYFIYLCKVTWRGVSFFYRHVTWEAFSFICRCVGASKLLIDASRVLIKLSRALLSGITVKFSKPKKSERVKSKRKKASKTTWKWELDDSTNVSKEALPDLASLRKEKGIPLIKRRVLSRYEGQEALQRQRLIQPPAPVQKPSVPDSSFNKLVVTLVFLVLVSRMAYSAYSWFCAKSYKYREDSLAQLLDEQEQETEENSSEED